MNLLEIVTVKQLHVNSKLSLLYIDASQFHWVHSLVFRKATLHRINSEFTFMYEQDGRLSALFILC